MKTIKRSFSIFIILCIINIVTANAIEVQILGTGTLSHNKICPNSTNIQYTAQPTKFDAYTYKWEVSEGNIKENNPQGSSIHINWNSTKQTGSIKVSVILNNVVVATKTQTIFFNYFNPKSPTISGPYRVESTDFYDYYIADYNYGGDINYSFQVTLPNGCESNYKNTGTYTLSKIYGKGLWDRSVILTVKSTKAYIKGEIKCVVINNTCKTESAPVFKNYEVKDLSKMVFTEYPTTGIPLGSTNIYNFSVEQIAGVNYSWKVPSSWQIVSGENTSSIKVKPSICSLKESSVSVVVSNDTKSQEINCNYPGIVGNFTISHPETFCMNSPETFSIVGPWSNCLSVKWPSFMKIISNNGNSCVAERIYQADVMPNIPSIPNKMFNVIISSGNNSISLDAGIILPPQGVLYGFLNGTAFGYGTIYDSPRYMWKGQTNTLTITNPDCPRAWISITSLDGLRNYSSNYAAGTTINIEPRTMEPVKLTYHSGHCPCVGNSETTITFSVRDPNRPTMYNIENDTTNNFANNYNINIDNLEIYTKESIIYLNNRSEPQTINIFSIKGYKIREKHINKGINSLKLPKGIYLIKSKYASKKVIVN